MLRNVGGADRVIRVILGLVIFLVGILAIHSTVWTVILAAIGIILFLTGIFGSCLLYVPFKINTNKAGKNQTETKG